MHLSNSSFQKIFVHIEPYKYRYVMVQVVSQQKSVSLSYTDKLVYQSHLNSSSAGLVYMLDNGRSNLTSYIASVEGYITAQVLAVPFSPKGNSANLMHLVIDK